MSSRPLPTRLDIDDLGYSSWLECYNDLVKEDLHNQPAIEFQWDPHDYPGSSMTVDMKCIKSGAFEEIFPLLPTEAAMEVILGLIQDDEQLKQRELLLQFLKKIPTRAQ
jgi:hypothetical protein